MSVNLVLTENQQDTTALTVRQAPYNIEAERALLGAILLNNDAFDAIADFLKPEHFALPFHGKIFSLIQKNINRNKLVNPVTLKPFLPDDEKIEDLSAFEYLVRLVSEAVSVINAKDYGSAIYDLYLRRALIATGNAIAQKAYDSPIDVTPLAQIEEAEQALYRLAETGQQVGKFESFDVGLKKAIEMANAAYKRDSKLSGFATYIHSLDEKMGGLQKSDLVVLAGRPGMGKTSLATNIAFNIANAYAKSKESDTEQQGGIVGFFSLEMSLEQLATRIIAEQAEISSSNIRKGKITEEEYSNLLRAVQRMQQLPLYIDQTGGINIAQLSARARRQKRQFGLDVLVIDYIQLISGSNTRASDSRVQEVTEITTGLKALAKELNIPIIALSQLSRQVENREDKRPQLSDLRESGSIEQDADVVLFVYREEYYKNAQEPEVGTEAHEKWQQEMAKIHNKAEIIIAKQRHGPTGIVELAFQAEYTRFSDLADKRYLPAMNE